MSHVVLNETLRGSTQTNQFHTHLSFSIRVKYILNIVNDHTQSAVPSTLLKQVPNLLRDCICILKLLQADCTDGKAYPFLRLE